jgi:hypothetical protein
MVTENIYYDNGTDFMKETDEPAEQTYKNKNLENYKAAKTRHDSRR